MSIHVALTIMTYHVMHQITQIFIHPFVCDLLHAALMTGHDTSCYSCGAGQHVQRLAGI